MSKIKSVSILVSVFILVLTVSSFAGAQYVTQQTATVQIPASGVASIDLINPETNTTFVSIDFAGAPGTNITVTAAVYQDNPFPGAIVPDGVELEHFIVISFNVQGNDFTQANVTFYYTDDDVQNIPSPYAIYKYIADSNIFVALPTTVDTEAQTLTVTLNNSNDPLFAIGNAIPVVTPTPTQTATPTASPLVSPTPTPDAGTPAWVWAALVVVIIAIVLVAVFILRKRKS